jgi:hypothetical protein
MGGYKIPAPRLSAVHYSKSGPGRLMIFKMFNQFELGHEIKKKCNIITGVGGGVGRCCV